MVKLVPKEVQHSKQEHGVKRVVLLVVLLQLLVGKKVLQPKDLELPVQQEKNSQLKKHSGKNLVLDTIKRSGKWQHLA